MKRLLLVSSILSALPAYAATSGVNVGSSMTTGPVSNPYSLSAASNNAAMTSLVMRKGEKNRFSFGAIGFNLEYGQVDGFIDDLEELTDILDDPGSTDDSSEEVIDRFNGVLETFGQEGYLKGNFHLNVPLLPFYIKLEQLGGSVGFDVSVAAQGGFSILDDPLEFNNQILSFSTATSIYLKAGTEITLSGSYKNKHGTFFGGVKAKVIKMELSKQLIPLESIDSDEIEDLLVDKYDKNLVDTQEFAVDLGFVWDAPRYRIGLALENLNEPEFKYGEVGANCQDVQEATNERSTCEVAKYFTQQNGEIAANEVHTKHAMARVDGVVKLTERLQVSAAMDLAEYNDIIGDEHRWYHVAASYDPESAIIPSLRVGYQENTAGTKTSSINFGASLFGMVNLDVQWGLDTIENEGDEIPRTFGISLSVDERF